MIVHDIARHRNGVYGAPFYVVSFSDDGDDLIAIVFDARLHTAVIDAAKAADGIIAFGENSWRGDRYNEQLRQAIARWEGAANLFPATQEAGP